MAPYCSVGYDFPYFPWHNSTKWGIKVIIRYFQLVSHYHFHLYTSLSRTFLATVRALWPRCSFIAVITLYYFLLTPTVTDIPHYVYVPQYIKGKAIPVKGRGSPKGCETSRLPYFLYNWLTDGGEVVSLTRRPSFTPRKIPGTYFC
jgi:hypothetical protein